ncbi:MAG: hypothetical protein KAS72_11850 [Phycisphaerales bacterium]|nr:hypothetical protein [Phycisphaerales bacterium]
MTRLRCWTTVVLTIALLVCASQTRAEKLHFTYLWHLEQPIYWPDQQTSGADRYERAWQSILRTDGGAAHPANNLRDIFSWPDRVAVYQYRARDSINAIRSYAEAGAQISYSGGLIENVQSLGDAYQLGYSPNWNASLREARGWMTSGAGKPRADIVVFPFHHPLLPLCDDSAIRKEIQLYKAMYDDAWSSWPGMSSGFFPPEIAFSERIIPILANEGINWVFVSGEHVSRACSDFPVVLGTGGINCDPPNAADQINPAQGNYFRLHIDRGCSPAEAYPFAFTPHRAQYVDPDSGAVSQVIIVPCSQSIGWKDGYSAIGLDYFNTLQAHNDPARPMLCVLAHDGDNAWGGGYSYYLEATPNLVASAQGAGYVATVVEEYLADHPVPADDIVHVEDGAWVNADGDFGSPQMLNWNWPPVNGSGQIDIESGWAEDIRNWAVITAAQNRLDTAEQIAGGVNINDILYPDAGTSHAERAWHYFLASLNSGYMYYGTALDMEVKPTIACNEAVQHADIVIGDASADSTPPTIWLPQRHPWNPGSTNFGPQYGYQQYEAGGDFHIWTFIYDVSGLETVTLMYRVDDDGTNPLDSTQNDTYAGGPEVGSWQDVAMTFSDFPAGNFHNDPSIDFFEMPMYIADQYYAEVTGLESVLVDYYIEAVDTKGSTKRSPIQHVYVGDGQGSGGDDVVIVDPDPPVAGQSVLIRYDPTGRPLDGAAHVYLHYGFNNWNPVISPDPAMTWNATDEVWHITVSVQSSATQLDMVFNNGQDTWDNNNGQDWHFAVTGGQPGDEWIIDGLLDDDAVLLAENGNGSLFAGIKGDVLYIACPDAGEGDDHFILLAAMPGTMQPAMWTKSGQVAAWDAYLADENENDYEGWFDAIGSTQAMTGANGGVLEGTINLAEQYGSIPDTIYLAFVPYTTPDGGALQYTYQVPSSINSDGNVDAAEYLAVDLCELRWGGTPGDLDGDGDVDQSDLGILLAAYQIDDTGDLDCDGDTDQSDLGILLANYSG